MKKDAYSLWLVGGSLLLVAASVPSAQRQAVLDCVLYGQLLADKKSGPRFEQYQQWYEEYRQALSLRGWIVKQRFYDTKPAADCSLLIPAQPLQLWLADRQADADDYIASALATLQKNADASRAFNEFVRLRTNNQTQLVLEIGLVLPGPVLHVSSISVALDSVAAAEPIPLDQPLRAASTAQVMVKGTSAFLDQKSFAAHAVDLRKLIEKKQRERAYLVELGPVAQGVEHE